MNKGTTMKLSVQAKPFRPKRAHGHLISWNVLSDSLTESIQQTISNIPGTPLFPPKLFKKRSKYLCDRLAQLIQEYRYPIFCLQEVNDSVKEEGCLMRILKTFLQTHHYRVFTISYGTFDPVYPELGLLTAIPLQLYDVKTFSIQQMDPSAPNAFIHTYLQTKGNSVHDFHIVNTHFPARFSDTKYMKRYTKQFVEYWEGYQNLIVCGDFNTMYDSEWYPIFENRWQTIKFPTHISHLSIQRRDRRTNKNTVFQGFLDHVFWTRSSLVVSFVEVPPMTLSSQEISILERPDRNDPALIPSMANPSDHYPLITQFQFLSS